MAEYKDSYQEAEENMNLTPEEMKVFEEMQKQQMNAQSEYTFRMRELQGEPNKKITLNVKDLELGGQERDMFEWLRFNVVKAGFATQLDIVRDIIRAGILHTYNVNCQGLAGAMMRNEMLNHMPDEIARQIQVQQIKAFVKERKAKEAADLKSQFDAPPKDDKK